MRLSLVIPPPAVDAAVQSYITGRSATTSFKPGRRTQVRMRKVLEAACSPDLGDDRLVPQQDVLDAIINDVGCLTNKEAQRVADELREIL